MWGWEARAEGEEEEGRATDEQDRKGRGKAVERGAGGGREEGKEGKEKSSKPRPCFLLSS